MMMIMLIVSILLLKIYILQGAFGFFILQFLSSLVDYEKMERKKYVPAATTDWSQLPNDLLEVVVRRIDRVTDHCRFGGVCKSWRSVAVENRRHLPNQLPLLMISAGNNNETRQFLRLSYKSNSLFQRFREFYLQEAEQQQQQQQQQLRIPHGHVCRGSAYGWLFLIDECNFDTKLLNPFSAEEIPLPSGTTLQPKRKYSQPLNKWASYAGLLGVLKVVFSSNPSFQLNPLVLIIYNVGCTTAKRCNPSSTTTIGCTCTPSRLAFCRPGDEAWICLHSPYPSPYENNPSSWKPIFCSDAIYYKDQFYVLLRSGHIIAYDIRRCHRIDKIKVTKIASAPKGFIPHYYGLMYLVEVEGQLVIVSRKIRLFPRQPNQDPCRDFYSIYDDGTATTSTTAVAGVYYDGDRDRDGDRDVYTWDREGIPEREVMCLVVNNCDHFVHRTTGFDLLRFDEASGGGGHKKWVKVKNLGNNALFLGNNTSFACLAASSSSSYSCISASNCIFFTEDCMERAVLERVRHHDLSIYEMKNGIIKNLSYTVSSSLERYVVSLPVWVTSFPW